MEEVTLNRIDIAVLVATATTPPPPAATIALATSVFGRFSGNMTFGEGRNAQTRNDTNRSLFVAEDDAAGNLQRRKHHDL